MKKLTVADILQLDILKNVTMCAGAAGLSHFVTGITTAEDPDLIQWLTGGEILLTSLYGAVTGPLSFKEYIDTLASKHISALFIKTGERMPQIPAEITQSGSHYGIPIVQLPPDVSFFDVVSSVMKQILNNKAQYFIELQNNMSQLLASGAGEQDILDYLAEYVPASIHLCDSDKNIIFTSQSEEFRSEMAIADRISLPIMCMGEVCGYLEAATNRYLDENLEGLLKNAANLSAVLYLKKYYTVEIEQRYISGFLKELFRQNMGVNQIVEKAEGYGWHKNDSYLAVSIQLEASRNITKVPEALAEMTRLIPKSNYYFCIQDDLLNIIYRTEKKLSPQELYGPVTEVITNLNQYISKTYGSFTFYAGISSIAYELFQLSQKIQEAADSLQFCRVFNNRLVRYEVMGALRMLATYSHRSNLEQVIPPAVTRLAEYDKLNNTQYLETLDSLLGNNLNLSKTAKQLFIHYKTMLHRMDRICEIAEISLDDRQTLLDVELGVKLYMMLPK